MCGPVLRRYYCSHGDQKSFSNVQEHAVDHFLLSEYSGACVPVLRRLSCLSLLMPGFLLVRVRSVPAALSRGVFPPDSATFCEHLFTRSRWVTFLLVVFPTPAYWSAEAEAPSGQGGVFTRSPISFFPALTVTSHDSAFTYTVGAHTYLEPSM
jgi:hypothetical protein